MSHHIVLSEKPATAIVINVATSAKATSQNDASSLTDVSIIVRDASVQLTDTKPQQWVIKRDGEGSDHYTIKSVATGKYAHPQGKPAEGVSIVENSNSYQWTIKSADGAGNGNLISVSHGDDVFYWGVATNSEDKSDIKLRTDDSDSNNHWQFHSLA